MSAHLFHEPASASVGADVLLGRFLRAAAGCVDPAGLLDAVQTATTCAGAELRCEGALLAGAGSVGAPAHEAASAGYELRLAGGAPGTEDVLPILATELARRLELAADAATMEQREIELTASRARVVGAADEERRRLRGHLHDGAQQQLAGIAQSLHLAAAKLPADAPAQSWLDRANGLVTSLTQELGDLARGLHPVGLERGLGPSLEHLAVHAAVPVVLLPVPERRLPVPVELTLFYVVSEALTNVAKHAPASEVEVEVSQRRDHVVLRVEDDGPGGATLDQARGLLGLQDRIGALGGDMRLTSPPTRGTRLVITLPTTAHRTARSPFLQVSADDADLVDHIVSRRRRVAAGLLREWEVEGGPPQLGQRVPVIDHEGYQRATIRITRTTVVRFGAITERVLPPADLGEASLETWVARARRGWAAMQPELRVLFDDPDWCFGDDEPVVLQWYELVDGSELSQ